ncbi:unnamed protein product [Chondrus crispus]|uniref:Uncharacterized protein n=1 Tax=Chondrus crispus TaxID=2769 RepID=R7Q9E4_CHOCR|nr:unnamed protein product [Chondrus crispus]CDF34095.1 unnamed protein product [Chondrus crispus]|eukprot:XP_005713914.1 unnamed protein product [Chondrus crispus]
MGAPGQRDIDLVRSGREARSGLSLPELVAGFGVGEGEYKWIYTGLHVIERRFDIVFSNCLTALLDKAEAPHPRVVLPVLLDDFPGVLLYTNSTKGDRRTPYWRKRSLEVRPAIEETNVSESVVEADVG